MILVSREKVGGGAEKMAKKTRIVREQRLALDKLTRFIWRTKGE
jgi:hypothetical protein